MNETNENQAVNKIPSMIALPQTIENIKQVKNKLIFTYAVSKHFEDGTTVLKEEKTLTLTYKRKIKDYNIEIDEKDNLIVIVNFATPWTFFGFTIKKEGN